MARVHALPARYRAAALGLPALTDPGYQGAGSSIKIPVRQPVNIVTSTIISSMKLPKALAPLALRSFRLLWIGQTASSAGTALVQLAFVFAILRIGGNAEDIGVIAGIQTIVKTGLIVAGGVWADRMRRQFVMLTADVIRAIVQATLAVLLISGDARIWHLAIGAALFGGADAFFSPASTGLVPETVDSVQLQKANSLMSLAGSFVRISGPAAAGILVAAFSPGWVFALDAVSFVASAISLGLLKLPPRVFPKPASFREDLAIGWHQLVIRPWYWLNLCAHACYNFAYPAVLVLGPVIAESKLGGSSAWGVASASFAAGATAGGIVALRVKPNRPLVAANLAGILSASPMLALAVPLDLWVIAITFAMSGAGLIILNTLWSSTMQELIPDEVRSRVDSYDWLISLIAMPAGFALVGSVAAHFGDAPTLSSSAALLGIPCALIVLVPGVRKVRRTEDGRIVGPPPRSSSISPKKIHVS